MVSAFATALAVIAFVLRASAAQDTPATDPLAKAPVDVEVDDAGAASPDAGPAAAAAAVPNQERKAEEDGAAPVGKAAPPTESAHGEGQVRPGFEVFAQYAYRNLDGPGGNRTWFHAFDVPRIHGAVEGEWERARGRVVIEAVRSASEGALIGVAGDSLVLRIREAFGAYRPIDALEVSAGVVPTLTVPELDGTWMMRAVAPSALESNGLLSPADIGIKARYELPRRYGWIATSAYNGEGYTSRELNRGKNVESAVEVHPIPKVLLPLGIFASYAVGSTGTTLARADRLTGGLVWQDARVRGGAYVTYAWGLAQLGRQRALVASAFVRVEPLRRVLVGARFDHAVRDLGGEPASTVSTIWGALGYRLATPLEVFLAFNRTIPTTRAQAELPGSDLWEARFITRVVF